MIYIEIILKLGFCNLIIPSMEYFVVKPLIVWRLLISFAYLVDKIQKEPENEFFLITRVVRDSWYKPSGSAQVVCHSTLRYRRPCREDY